MRSLNPLVFFTSLIALSLEVLGAQSIFAFFSQSSQAFSISLASFFMGLGLASFLSGKYYSFFIKNICRYLSFGFGSLSVFILFYLFNFSEIIAWALYQNNLISRSIWFYLLCGSFLFVPALLLGFVFPLLAESLKSNQNSRFGYFNTWDLLGAIAGSLFVGFVFLPLIGLKNSFVLIAILSSILSLCLHLNTYTCLLTLVTWLGFVGTPRSVNSIDNKILGDILYQKNSAYGLVSVAMKNNSKSIYINYREMCSGRFHPSEKRLAELALSQISVSSIVGLNIGLGCGFTAARATEDKRIQDLFIAEINPVVAEANRLYFQSETQRLLEKDNVHLVIKDGLEYINTTNMRYDMVLVDIEEPTIVHSSALYAVDGFLQIKKKMTADAVFGLWSFEQDETAKIILNSLRHVFRYAYIYPEVGRSLFFASDRELNFYLSAEQLNVAKRIENVPVDLIATVANNPYPRFYKLDNIFAQPKDYQDPFEIRKE